ncbi:MAG: hypothetical protein EOO11_16185 [Chitinophagaceae bacterium]|nr:MAG: hypothetical protein EOO11_16185 [Chitinophagaceae bacterium]
MKKALWSATIGLCSMLAVSCGSGSDNSSAGSSNTTAAETQPAAEAPAASDPKGVGPVKDVKLNTPLDAKLESGSPVCT